MTLLNFSSLTRMAALLLIAVPVYAQVRVRTEAPKIEPPPEQLTPAEMVQYLSSHYMAASEQQQVKDMMDDMAIAIGDVRRVTNLPKDRERLLTIAAKGSVDRALEGWRTAQENNVRQQVTGIPPDQVEQRLSQIGSVTVSNDGAEKNALWSTTIEQVLTPEERAKWAASEQQRRNYRLKALGQMLVAELDRQIGLTLGQCEQLEPLAVQALQDYLPDMAAYMDRSSGMDFRMLLLMLSGVPQDKTQSILLPDQIAKWQMLTNDFRGWWQSIDQNHRNRTGNQPQAVPIQGSGVLQIQGGGQIQINGGGVIIKQAK